MNMTITLDTLLSALVLAVLSLIGRWVLETRDNTNKLRLVIFGENGAPNGLVHKSDEIEKVVEAHTKDIQTISVTLWGRNGDNGLVGEVHQRRKGDKT